MKRDEFIKAIDDLVLTYIESPGKYDTNPQLRVNPATLSVGLINGREMMAEIEEADETVEN
ncbi:MAG: hypothetical protein K2M76_02275, partial [Muribaculaceae bacterium]|nr:hypothetical protein [Muribaculaceae bacterium]